MHSTAVVALAVLAAYLLGSISFAVVVSKLMRLPDPRSYGSKNPGATNVLRTGRKLAAVLTLLGDAGKGYAAVWLARLYLGESAAAGIDIPLVGLAAFFGHLFPVFHRLQGGKGVATAAGVLFGFDLWLGLATLSTWVAIAAFFRLSSLAALIGSIFAPVYAWWLFGLRPVFPAVFAIGVLLIWRHRGNIARLLAGQETRIGEKAKPS
ncbi:MAG: glycerol-3-phosphate 1-O-acyltransferase PlsY [Betaproteobacteria bacterium]|nr:glycerol-3-phosphate 1-O-acyltransferase PlsY [Betaproteobacteria bacterium]